MRESSRVLLGALRVNDERPRLHCEQDVAFGGKVPQPHELRGRCRVCAGDRRLLRFRRRLFAREVNSQPNRETNQAKRYREQNAR